MDITHDIDVALAASLAGIREADFRALNPSFHKPVILAAGTPQILLPWDNAKVFQRNLEAHKEGQYASWTVWSVPTTMTVAEAARRTDMSESDLRSVNNIPPRMMIKAGSALIVPRSATTRQDVSSHLADNGQVALAPEIVTRRASVRAGGGETVATLARRYKVSAANVADWNDVKLNAAFKAGQQVVMYLPVRQASAPAPRAQARSAPGKVVSASTPSAVAVRHQRCGGADTVVRAGWPVTSLALIECVCGATTRTPAPQGAQRRMDATPIRPKIPMMIRYSATMVLSSRGMTRMRMPAIKDTNGPMR